MPSPSDTSDGDVAPAYVVLTSRGITVSHVLWSFVAGALGFITVNPARGIPDVWILHVVLILALALASQPGRDGRRSPSALVAVLICMAGFTVGALLAGAAPTEILRTAIVNLVSAVTTVQLYHHGHSPRSWIPRTPGEAIILLVCLVVGSVPFVFLAAFPDSGLGGAATMAQTQYAIARYLAAVCIGAHCIIPLYFRPAEEHLHAARRGRLPLFIAVYASCILIPNLFPHYPLTWLFIAPAVWAGVTLPLRTASVALFLASVIAILTPYPRYAPPPYPFLPAPQAMLDWSFAFGTHLMLLLVIFREQQLRLTVQMETLAATRRSEHELMNAVVESMSDGLLLVDSTGTVLMHNAAAESLAHRGLPTRIDPEEIDVFGIQAADTRRIVDAVEISRMLTPARGEERHLDVLLPRPDGDARLSVSSSSVTTHRDVMTLLTFKDISEAWIRQQELESFAGTVAHDLKGPLAALSGWMEAAEDELAADDLDTGRMALGRARDAIERMRALIDDYLAFAVSRGGTIRPVDLALADIVAEIVAVSPDTVTFDLNLPHHVHADPSLIRQLMANLIGNGIKFTRPGIPAHLHISSDHHNGQITVTVADEGRGLHPGDEARIFGRLTRGQQGPDQVSGTGLGLALCEAIVTRHGGTIGAFNNDWGGATFTFTLPAAGDP
ncbi:Adaptive-response sensory-kinase SasA [Austwickia sp. TVS 96-490-7B]|uniref:sensor histidine kinase n=1 Tax=Austwickia sp. TVS 96-490-7B TaxID=2830843 RepID=UPI001C59784C|nr:PAS domain-containing sensor histidine kinase [Austwickia sp. TVS 96-490-7B]MBW3086262.1 Adaptive-response sensory-kinase SasA [Austwickia sp. TVS 96-490-7B]